MLGKLLFYYMCQLIYCIRELNKNLASTIEAHCKNVKNWRFDNFTRTLKEFQNIKNTALVFQYVSQQIDSIS
jgi:hypothetical protein